MVSVNKALCLYNTYIVVLLSCNRDCFLDEHYSIGLFGLSCTSLLTLLSCTMSSVKNFPRDKKNRGLKTGANPGVSRGSKDPPPKLLASCTLSVAKSTQVGPAEISSSAHPTKNGLIHRIYNFHALLAIIAVLEHQWAWF